MNHINVIFILQVLSGNNYKAEGSEANLSDYKLLVYW